MVKYFTYHMKKTVIRFVVMALFLVMMANSFTVTSYSYMGIDNVNVSLSSFSVFAIVAPAIVAALEFSQFMNRRNLDTWFSLPISRRDLFIVHFANGAIQLIVSVLLGAVLAAVRIGMEPALDLAWLFPYILCVIGAMLLLYMLYSFFFVSANNVFDGCLFMSGAFFIPLSAFSIFQKFFLAFASRNSDFGGYDTLSKIPFDGAGIFSVIVDLASKFTALIEPSQDTEIYDSFYRVQTPEVSIPQACLWFAICIAAFMGAIYVFKTKKTEAVSGISETWFGYKILIPLCSCAILQTTAMAAASMRGENGMSEWLSLAGLIPAFIGIFVAYVIFRRGVKFKISDLISAGVIIVFYIASFIIFKVAIG